MWYLRRGLCGWLCLVVLQLSMLSFSELKANAALLSDLLAGGEVVSGDKRFYGFENYIETGDLSVSAATIQVIPIQTIVLGQLEYGIRFQTPTGWELNGANKNYDMSLDFHVMRLDGLALITDNTLEFTGNYVGGGEAHLVEGVVDDDTLDTLANKEVFLNLGGTGVDKLIDHQIFAHPAARLRISKDFQLQTRFAGDNIFVSHFDQTFSQVPEPSGLMLSVIGAVCMLNFYGTRRLNPKNRLNI
ncbi:MAG: hypothetical protein KF752_06175 [Pirellulaceae bacterium]|nr:hypothetical protein [Pirellulaceae bacterium]